MYFKKKERFLDLIDNGEFDWQSDEKKERKYILRINIEQHLISVLASLFRCSFMWNDDDCL
jgi:hypothetical protein